MYVLCLLIVLKSLSISVGSNRSFIDEYISPSVVPYCTEEQENLQFQYSFRARRQRNINSHSVLLFTKDKVFSIWQMTASLNTRENISYVIPEIFFNDVKVKDLNEFWDGKHPNDTFNSVFSDPLLFDMSFWIFGDKYRAVNISLKDLKVTEVQEPIDFSKGKYGFMQNQKIAAKGFQNIFGIDIADSGGFRPIRVYVRDLENDGKAISFAFYNDTETTEEFENGKHYSYSFDSAAFLVFANSLDYRPKLEQYKHYFELRTRRTKFSLFDFTYNRDFLLVGTNEELLGCPPSFCHSREFDDIIRLHDGTKLLIFHEWVWNFSKPGHRIEWKDAVISDMLSRKHISREKNFPEPFKFGIRHIVDGSFIDDSMLYIFRNGSFISSNDDSIVNKSTPFTEFKPIGQFFKGVPSQTFDALLYHKEWRTVFFIKEDKFWEYSMANKALTSEDFPKHVENLGLPFDFKVWSTYVEEDSEGKQIEFYLFTENRYIVFKESEFKGGRFLVRKHTYFCTSVNFFGCADGQYVCPELETEPQEPSDEGNNVWLYFIILMIIIVVLLAIIALFLLYVFLKKSDKTIPENKSANKGSANKPTSGKDKGNVQQMDSSISESARSTRL